MNNAHLWGGMDCVTALYAGVADFSPIEKEQFVRFSLFQSAPHHYFDSKLAEVNELEEREYVG